MRPSRTLVGFLALAMVFALSSTAFAATRPVVTATNGMVASAHPLASQAGLRILMAGGNAIDAAVATAATLNVVEPDYSSLAGGGAFVIFEAATNRMAIINANAPAPSLAYLGRLTSDDAMRGPKAGMVPSGLAAWAAALDEFGTMSLASVLQPAIEYAENGFPITERLAGALTNPILAIYPTSARTYLRNGIPPQIGEILVQPDLARTLRTIAQRGPEAFYEGVIAREMTAFYEANDGSFRYEDFANYETEWIEPVSTTYRGYEVFAPGGEWGGIMLIEQLNILEGYDVQAMGRESADTLHVMIEATKLAGADRDAYVADPAFVDVPEATLISKAYADAQRARITPRAAMDVVEPGDVTGSASARTQAVAMARGEGPENTTHISVVDRWGNMVAYTTSIGSSWGTGVVVGNTGVLFNNGGGWMSFEQGHINVLAPGKRPMNNIAPVLISRDGKPFLTLGTPGGDAIWQTMFQLIVNIIDFDMDIQDAIEYPRYRTYNFGGNQVRIEPGVPEETIAELQRRGHNLQLWDGVTSSTGGAQGIVVDPDTGVMMGGADPRRDGYVVGW